MSHPKMQKPVARRDATGHLNPEYERKLREESALSRNRDGENQAFVDPANATEELAEELAEAFVLAVTSGDDAAGDRHERVVAAEVGGPFVPSVAGLDKA